MAVKIFSKPLNADVEQVQNDLAHGLKIGEIKLYSGSIAPSRWKICDGSVISRSDYSALFGVIGTAWGGDDGETTFAIPDFKGRTPIGVGESVATGHTAHALGQIDGEEKHMLSTAELASHTHWNWSMGSSCSRGQGTYDGAGMYLGGAVEAGGVQRSNKATGSNTAHNTMQPYAVCTFIIYTGVEES